MGQNLVHLTLGKGDLLAGARARVARMLSIVDAINADELFAAVPDCPVARRHNQLGIDLLLELEVELRMLAGQLDRPNRRALATPEESGPRGEHSGTWTAPAI